MYANSDPAPAAATSVSSFVPFDAPDYACGGPVSVSRLVKSVVEEAGLGRFVYLKGQSGRRYIFSAIRTEQVELYRRAVFALTGVAGDVRVLDDASKVRAGTPLYVHLLDDDADAAEIMGDINPSNA